MHAAWVHAAWARWGALVLIGLWAVYQAFWRLGNGNVQTDEPAYQQPGWQYLHGDLSENRQHPPTAKYLMGLAQLVFGEGVTGARIAVAVLGLATGLVLFLWLRRDVGWWTGLLAAGMWWLLPHGILDDPSRIDRLALLDGPMVAFGVAAMWCGWRWASGGRWPWILAAGVLAGLSVTSKEVGALLLPAFVLLPLLFRRWWALLWGGALFAAGFVVAFVLPYLPFGVLDTVRFMIEYQGQHAADGHLVEIAGIVTRHSPWWANLWYQWKGTGTLASIVLGVGTLAALLVRPGRLVAWLALSIVPIAVFYMGVSDVALGEYYIAWVPMLTALAAIGIARLAGAGARPTGRRAAGRRGAGRRVVRRPSLVALVAGRVVAGALVATAGVSAVSLSAVTATIHPSGVGLLPEVLAAEHRPDAFVLAQGISPSAVAAFVGKNQTRVPAEGRFDMVVIGKDRRYGVDPAILEYFREHRDRFRVYHLDEVEVLVPKDGQFVLTPLGYTILPRP